MQKQRHDLFAEDHRRQKITQFTKVLDALSRLVDWAALTKVVNAHTGREASQPKGGRPPYPTEVLVKIIVLQQLYGNLSDEDTEYALLDRGIWQRFIGMADARDLPDARTIWHFKCTLRMRTAHGKRGRSNMPTVFCGSICRAVPTWTSSRKLNSTKSLSA